MRIVVAPRSRISPRDASEVVLGRDEAQERGGLLADLLEEGALRLGRHRGRAQPTTRARPSTSTRSISRSSLRTTTSAGSPIPIRPAPEAAEREPDLRRGADLRPRAVRRASGLRNCLDHRERASGERAGSARDAVMYLDVEVAEPIRAVVEPAPATASVTSATRPWALATPSRWCSGRRAPSRRSVAPRRRAERARHPRHPGRGETDAWR